MVSRCSRPSALPHSLSRGDASMVSPAYNPTRVTAGPAMARKSFATPHVSSTGRLVDEMNSPQTLRRGKTDFSISATCHPDRASSSAVDDPAGPAPITAASNMAARTKDMGEGKNGALLQDPGLVLPMTGQFLA